MIVALRGLGSVDLWPPWVLPLDPTIVRDTTPRWVYIVIAAGGAVMGASALYLVLLWRARRRR